MVARGKLFRLAATAAIAVFTVAMAQGCVSGPPPQSDVVSPPPEEQTIAIPTATSEPEAASPVPAGSPTPVPSPTTDPVPRTIRKALSNLYANLDWFQGIASVSVNPGTSDSTSTNVRQWFREPILMKLEVVRGSANAAPAGSAFVYDGQTLTYFDPIQNHVLELQSSAQLLLFLYLPQDRLLPQIQLFQAPRFLAGISELGEVTVEGTTKVANRNATVVSIIPKNPTPRYAMVRLWLDERTLGPLRAEALRQDGSVLVRIEYQQFSLLNEVEADAFAFSPPSQVDVLSPKPEDLAGMLDYRSMTLEELQDRAGFPVLQPTTLPPGVARQSARLGSFSGTPIAAFLYGDSPENPSTLLIERPAQLQLPVLRNAEPIDLNGVPAEIHQAGSTVIIDWVVGDTALTLATDLSREQAQEMAAAVR